MMQDLLPFGRALLPWLGINISEARIRNLALTVENIAEFTTEAMAAKEKSSDSLANVDVDYRVAPDYLLAEQGDVCAVVTTTCYTWINKPGEVESQLHKTTEQSTWLKKVTLSTGCFLTYLILIALGLGDHGSKVHSRHWGLSCL